MSRLFLDANVPTYAAGRDHPLKEPCKEVLWLAAKNPGAFFTDAEVLQEMLHRYLALRRWPEGKQIIIDFAAVMRGAVEAVRVEDVERACELADQYATGPGSGLTARDVLRVAVMLRRGSSRIVTADGDFDEFSNEGIERLDPAEVERWRGDVARSMIS